MILYPSQNPFLMIAYLAMTRFWRDVRPIVLDTFCGGGGAGYGYHLAGFIVIGVDSQPQPNYPFLFVQMDALEAIERFGSAFDLIHASPPCQRFSPMTRTAGTQEQHPDMIAPVRTALVNSGIDYVIENVPEAPLYKSLLLCGTSFDLDVIRHRVFETSFAAAQPGCHHTKPVVEHGRKPDLKRQYHGVTGHFSGIKEARQAMQIYWMTQRDLSQAIPPAYTEFVGTQWRGKQSQCVCTPRQLTLALAI